jgi:type I restriction enzyme S subunit
MSKNYYNMVTLGDVLDYEQPTNYIVDKADYNDEFEIPVLTAGKTFLLGYTDETHNVFENVPVIIFDDFTTAFKYVDFPFKVKSSAMKILKAKEEIADIKFLYYRMMKTGIDTQLHKRYWISKYSKVKIPLPPLEQQKKIAAILDAADTYRQKTKALITKYDALTQSLFLDMFGDTVTNPKGWKEKSLDEVSSLTTKGSSPKWQGFEYISEGVRFVTSENVRLGHLNISKDKFVALEFHKKLLRSQLKENDLLVNLVGASIGRGALVSKDILPANINQAVAKTELDISKVNPIFILYQVVTPQIQDRLIGNKVEGARANISLKNVRELVLYIPPIALQNQFVERVKAIELQKTQAQASLAQADNLFNSLLQRAFKGELV